MSYQHHLEVAPRAEVVAPFPARGRSAAARSGRLRSERLRLSFHGDIAAIENEWRAFEENADGTVFQTFAWQSCWLQHIGGPGGFQPLIAVLKTADGRILMLAPLAVGGRPFRQLGWAASDLSDYNAPLLAPDFEQCVSSGDFRAVWGDMVRSLRRDPRFRFDLIVLDKMPETVGRQPNPFLALPVALNASGAYLTHLIDDWNAFYVGKRSSATRRRDRTKRKRLNDMGPVACTTPGDAEGTNQILTTLFAQKGRAFGQMGIVNFLALPGREAFFRAFATDPATRQLCHVSRLDVGPTLAAANYGLIFRGRYYHVLASYDDGPVSRFGPGAAHLHDLMRYAIEHGCNEFDFTIGDEPYKHDWCDTEIKLFDYRSAATLRGWLAALPAIAFARAKRLIKQTPFLWRLFVRTRTLLARAPSRAQPGTDESEAPSVPESASRSDGTKQESIRRAPPASPGASPRAGSGATESRLDGEGEA
jgi:CelD/BcsL family acetyltransferase involved in cellulose biosynthesis